MRLDSTVHHEAEQGELLAFSHAPIRAPRPSVIGEVVMVEKWQENMARYADSIHDECDEYAFRALMTAFPFPLTQRLATVAASFVKWLGTNCGRCFLLEAERVEKLLDGKRDSWAAAWAIENARHSGHNGGARYIEAALAPDDHWQNGLLTRLPDLTAHDVETVEHVVYWLGTTEGRAFLADCEREIAARTEAGRRAERAEWLRKHVPPARKRDEWR
jgi:hypothetical protein